MKTIKASKTIKAFLNVLTITAAFCVGTPVHSQTFLTDGLVAYYPFNGNANDASGHGNNGLGGDYVFTGDRFGQPMSAVSFDRQPSGGRGIQVPTIATLKDFPMTYSVWFNLQHPFPSKPQYISIMTLLGRNQEFSTSVGALAMFDSGSGPTTTSFVYFTGESGIPTLFSPTVNKWYNLVFTIDSGQSATFYLNGVRIESTQPSGFVFTTDKSIPITIGDWTAVDRPSNPYIPLYSWDGDIDDVRIYNRALTQQEVTDLYAYESRQSLPSVSTVVKTIEVTMHVVPRKTYQLQASLDLATWKNVGNPFVALTSSIVQDFDATEVGQYFRIQELSANHHSSK